MFEKYVQPLRDKGPTPEILKAIIKDHKPTRARMIDLYERYKGTAAGVPIFTRVLPAEGNKINNKLANDWVGEVVDTKHGYMFGVPIQISIEKSLTDNYDKTLIQIERFRKINNLDDLNAETGKFAAICGYDSILAYIDPDGVERSMRVDPWEACIITQTELTEPEFGLRYYILPDKTMRAEFFDNVNITVFAGKNENGLTQAGEPRPHLFDYCPMVGVPNNAELQGDAEKVLSLIDAYDRSTSDFNSEIEQFRLAYLLFIGHEPDEDQIEKMRQTGALYIPTSSDGEDIRFLTKTIAHEAIDSHLDRLTANIIRFAKHVNFSDAAFGGDITGPAMRFKLFMLETKAKTMERKHEAALLYLFKVIGSAWKKRSLPGFDYTLLDFKYTRNVPVNLLDAANTLTALWGKTSKKTALSVMPNIADIQEELDQIDEENAGAVNLDNPNLTGGDE